MERLWTCAETHNFWKSAVYAVHKTSNNPIINMDRRLRITLVRAAT